MEFQRHDFTWELKPPKVHPPPQNPFLRLVPTITLRGCWNWHGQVLLMYGGFCFVFHHHWLHIPFTYCQKMPFLSKKCLFTQHVALRCSVVVVAAINPIPNYQGPSLSINTSPNFMIWWWNEEKSVSNRYHACLNLALFFLPLPRTRSLRSGAIKRRLLGLVCYWYLHFPQHEKRPVVLLHTSHAHFCHSLILWGFSQSGRGHIGSRRFALCIGKLYFLFHFSITASPVLSISQQNVLLTLSAFHIRFMPEV